MRILVRGRQSTVYSTAKLFSNDHFFDYVHQSRYPYRNRTAKGTGDKSRPDSPILFCLILLEKTVSKVRFNQ
jgi:hypothetical protein